MLVLPLLGDGVKVVVLKTNQIKMLKLSKLKKLTFKLEDQENEPLFLRVKSRDTVLVGEDEICKVLSFVGGARDPLAPTLFQVANVDTGEIKFVHGEEVREIVSTYEQEVQKRLESPTEGPITNILPTVENYEKKIGKKKLSGNELKKRLESPTPTEL